MDFPSLLAAYLIGQGSHTGGHFYQGMNPSNPMGDVPMKLDAKNLVENWQVPDNWQPPSENSPWKQYHISHEDYLKDNNRKSANIHGAGFEMQDRMRQLIENDQLRNDTGKVNALIKGLYLLGVPMKLSKQIRSGGDIGGIKETSGSKYTKPLLGASMVADLYDLPVGFKMVDGAPGLMFTKRW